MRESRTPGSVEGLRKGEVYSTESKWITNFLDVKMKDTNYREDKDKQRSQVYSYDGRSFTVL